MTHCFERAKLESEDNPIARSLLRIENRCDRIERIIGDNAQLSAAGRSAGTAEVRGDVHVVGPPPSDAEIANLTAALSAGEQRRRRGTRRYPIE